ncbi:MAG: hypothetical protein QNJ34_12440 [Xenococcaceae cyanobacterium MO_188.B29]|nr:hypothetical protein [Xenococcaceae cyanobacterium MO_188.B29]
MSSYSIGEYLSSELQKHQFINPKSYGKKGQGGQGGHGRQGRNYTDPQK